MTPLVWLMWGFFMGLGWTLASWLVSRALDRLSAAISDSAD